MPLQIAGQTGAQSLSDGADAPIRQGRLADVIVSELQARFYEANYRGALYGGGISTLTTIAAATFTTATLGATCTPIIGLYNPFGNLVNAVIQQAMLSMTMTALAVTGGGPYVWATAIGQSAISTGNTPFNRKTLFTSGSLCKDMSGVALTGLVGNLALRVGSALGGGSASNASFTATAVAMQTQLAGFVENIDGSIIVPPGGVLALLATTTPVAHSVVSGLNWAEVPI